MPSPRCGLLLGLVLATGCRQILGIDDPTVQSTVPVPVTGRVQLRDAYNLADGTPMTRARNYTAAEITVSVRLDDGTTPAVTIGDGTFAFERATADQPYRLTVGTPRTIVTYEHDAEHLELADRLPGRADAAPVTLPTTIRFSFAGGVGYPLVLSTGVWTQSLPIVSNRDDFVFDWRTAAPLQPAGLLRDDLGDRLYLGSLEILPDYVALTQVERFEIKLDDGQNYALGGVLSNLALDTCVRIKAARFFAMQRLRAAMPAFTGPGEALYQLSATTSGDIGNPFQRLLVYDIAATDADLDVAYANPFRGTDVVARVEARNSRTTTGSAAMTLRIGGYVSQLVPTTALSECRELSLASTIEVPGVPTIAGVTLATDDLAVGLPAGVDPVVAWPNGTAGAADIRYVTLYEVIANAGAAIPLPPTVVARQTVGTRAETVTFDRDRFTANSLYFIAVDTSIGVPGAATGDLDTNAYPSGSMRSVSSTFRVAN